MDINLLTDFFMWCSIINVVLLTVSFLICGLAGNFVYSLNKKFFPLKRDAFEIVIYSLLGGFKLLVILFNVVPYIVLVIIT